MWLPGALLSPSLKNKKKNPFSIFSQKKSFSYISGNGTFKPNLEKIKKIYPKNSSGKETFLPYISLIFQEKRTFRAQKIKKNQP